MVSPLNPRKYMGPDVYLANYVMRPRRPTTRDFRQPETGRLYPIFCGWAVGKDPSTGVEGELYMLTKIIANEAYWQLITTGTPVGTMVSITGDDGTIIDPDIAGNIDILGNTVANGTNAKPLWTYSSALNTMTADLQVSKHRTGAPSDMLDAGLCSFDDSVFNVDANGYVTLIAGNIDLHTSRFIVSAGGITDGANYTTIAISVTAAALVGGSQTVFIQPGTYTEDFTLPALINLTAFPTDCQTPSVTILGTVTCTDAGTRSISGIRLRTNGAAALSITGVAATNVKLVNVYFTATDAFGIVNSSSGGGTITLIDCNGDCSGANSLFDLTVGNTLFIINSRITGTTTPSTVGNGCNIALAYATLFFPVQTSGNSTLGARNSLITSTNSALVVGSTGEHNLTFCSVGGPGAVAAMTIAAGCTVTLNQCKISATTANVITGAGTIYFSGLTYDGTGSTITVTTQNLMEMSNFAARVTLPAAYPYTVKAQDYFLPISTTSARTINLPAAPVSGEEHVIKDNTGSAAANNITVQGNGNNIDGIASKVINTNYGAVTFTYNGTQWNAW